MAPFTHHGDYAVVSFWLRASWPCGPRRDRTPAAPPSSCCSWRMPLGSRSRFGGRRMTAPELACASPTDTLRAGLGGCGCGALAHGGAVCGQSLGCGRAPHPLCWDCRERTAFRLSRADPDWQLPLRRGTVIVPLVRDTRLAEICLLPFVFVVPEPRIAWEPCSILRIGPCLDRVEPTVALRPLVPLLSGRRVRVRESGTFYDPVVRRYFREFDLVVGLDRGSFDAVAPVWSLPDTDSLASLADEVPWRDVYGRALHPLRSWWSGDPHAPSALQTCALVAHVLSKPARGDGEDDRCALDYLLARRSAVFEESSWAPPIAPPNVSFPHPA